MLKGLSYVPPFTSFVTQYDVFTVAIKECEEFQQLQKCAGEKTHKGRSPTAFFRRPSRYCGAA
jgi:hypothetical protein